MLEKSQTKLQCYNERRDPHAYRDTHEPKKLNCLNLVNHSAIEVFTVALELSEYAHALVLGRANQHAFAMRQPKQA